MTGDIPMEPLHYLVMFSPEGELPATTASTVDPRSVRRSRLRSQRLETKAQASKQSIHQIDPKSPGWMRRNFLVHENLRFVRITGVASKEQLGGDAPIDHKLMLVILRRYCQSDRKQMKNRHT